MNKIGKLGALLAIVGIVLIVSGAVLQHLVSENGSTTTVISDRLEFEGIREIAVITNSLPVSVSYGDTDKIIVEYTSALPLLYNESNGFLRLTQDDSFTINLFSAESRKSAVEIILPHKIYESLTVSSSSGDITVDSINADIIDISTRSGNIKAENVDERAKVKTVSGNIELSVSSLNGDFIVNGGSGDVSVTISEELSFMFEFWTEKGHFTSDIFDKKYSYNFGDAAALYNGADHLFRIITTEGDLVLRK